MAAVAPVVSPAPRPAAVVDRVTARAVQIRPGRVLLTVLGAVLYVAGWLIAKAFGLAWLAVAWAAAAVQVGWEDARRPAARPSRDGVDGGA